VEVFCALYYSTFHALNLPTGITMHITYSNIPNQNKLITNVTPYWNLPEYNNKKYKSEDVFQDDNLVPTISTSFIIFDGVKVTPHTKYLDLEHIILIYISRILNESIYKSTSRLANVYYEGANLYGNINK